VDYQLTQLFNQISQYADVLFVGLLPVLAVGVGVRLLWLFITPVFKAAGMMTPTRPVTYHASSPAPTPISKPADDGLTPMQRELVKLLRQYLAVKPCGHCGTPLNQWHPNCPNCGAPRGR
jgi:hypothetical protein